MNTSKRSQNSSHSQEYDDDDVGSDSNAMENNVNNHFGRYSLRNAAAKNSKEEHQQRLKKLDESWKSILDEIVIEYVTNIGYHGKPSYSETTLFGDSCDCVTTRTKEVLCVYLTGQSIVY